MTDHDAVREHLKYYRDLGVMGTTTDPNWRERARNDGGDSASAAGAASESAAESAVALAKADVIDADPAAALAAVRDFIGLCTRCKLHGLGRRTVVFGSG